MKNLSDTLELAFEVELGSVVELVLEVELVFEVELAFEVELVFEVELAFKMDFVSEVELSFEGVATITGFVDSPSAPARLPASSLRPDIGGRGRTPPFADPMSRRNRHTSAWPCSLDVWKRHWADLQACSVR